MQKRQNKHPDPTPWLFLGPSLCGVTLFVLAPFVETVRRSVTDTMGRHFVGLANYTAVLGNDAFRLAVEIRCGLSEYAFRCCWRSVWHWLWRYGRKA